MLSDKIINALRPILLKKANEWIGAAESEDAVQQCFLDYLESGISTGGGIEADLCLCLSNVCNSIRRVKKNIREIKTPDFIEIQSVKSDVARESLTTVALERFESAILTKRQREVMNLHLQGHNNEEIAFALFLSPRTIRHHLQKVREILAENVVTLSEFRSIQAMFDFCSEVTIYHAPVSVGARLNRISNY